MVVVVCGHFNTYPKINSEDRYVIPDCSLSWWDPTECLGSRKYS